MWEYFDTTNAVAASSFISSGNRNLIHQVRAEHNGGHIHSFESQIGPLLVTTDQSIQGFLAVIFNQDRVVPLMPSLLVI